MRSEDFFDALGQLDEDLLGPVADDAARSLKKRSGLAFLLVSACVVAAVVTALFALGFAVREPTLPPTHIADESADETEPLDGSNRGGDEEPEPDSEPGNADDPRVKDPDTQDDSATDSDSAFVSNGDPEPTDTNSDFFPVVGPGPSGNDPAPPDEGTIPHETDSAPVSDVDPAPPDEGTIPHETDSAPVSDVDPVPTDDDPVLTDSDSNPVSGDDPEPTNDDSEPPEDSGDITDPPDSFTDDQTETGNQTDPVETHESESSSDPPEDPEIVVTKDDLCRYIYTKLENAPSFDLPGTAGSGSDPVSFGFDPADPPDESIIITEDEYGSVWFYGIVERGGCATQEELKMTAHIYKRFTLVKREMARMLVDYLVYKFNCYSSDGLSYYAVRDWPGFSDVTGYDAFDEDVITAYVLGLIDPVNEEVLGGDDPVTADELDAAIERLDEMIP